MAIRPDSYNSVGLRRCVGGYLDRRLRRPGQARVKSCLTTWWVKLADIHWYNLGREEALFAVEVMDRLFGSGLVSPRRMIVVVLVTFGCGGLIIAFIILCHVAIFEWSEFFYRAVIVWALITLCSLASFSITRRASVVVAQLLTQVPFLNFVGLVCLFLFQYALLCYWIPLVHLTLWSVASFDQIIYNYYHAYMSTTDMIYLWFMTFRSMLFGMFMAAIHGAFINPMSQVHNIVSLLTVTKKDVQPLAFMLHLSAILNLIPILTRLALMAIFIGSFFLHVTKEEIMLELESIIESDKPVFTYICGGTAAFVTTIHEVIKIVST
jgi:hypothetical protein